MAAEVVAGYIPGRLLLLTMRGRRPAPIDLSDDEVRALTRIIRRHTAPQSLARRARIILRMHDGVGNTAIARESGLSVRTVEMWRARWRAAQAARRDAETEHLDALVERDLTDSPRSGAPPTFTAEQIAQIIALGLRPPEDFDRPVTHWTPRELADEAVKQGIVVAISERTVGRFLK